MSSCCHFIRSETFAVWQGLKHEYPLPAVHLTERNRLRARVITYLFIFGPGRSLFMYYYME